MQSPLCAKSALQLLSIAVTLLLLLTVLSEARAETGLLDHRGAPVDWSALAEGPRLLYFGFTFCPDVCPTALNDMTVALEDLGEAATGLTPIFVSVDPVRDRPAVLADYLAHFDPRMLGITGEILAVDALAADHGVIVERLPPDADGDYTVDHSAAVLLVDGNGAILARFPQGTPPGRMAGRVRALIGGD